MSRIRKLIAAGMVCAAVSLGAFVAAPAAHAGYYGPPKYGQNVTYYNCQGPYRNPYNYWDHGVWYRCWADYDWWAEWTRGEVDRWVWVQGWYYA